MNSLWVTKRHYDGLKVTLHHTELPSHTADLAMRLIERWGIVAAEPDGEDSAGRAKLKLQSPEDLVQRAFTVAELAMDEAHRRGLMCVMPEDAKAALQNEIDPFGPDTTSAVR